MSRVVALGADHGGFPLKTELIPWLKEQGYDVLDVGAHSLDAADDYPDFAERVGKAVVAGQAEIGVLICGSGVGASVAANKVLGIRASVCHDTYSARQGVEHDDLNVVCVGARIVGIELAKEVVTAFLSARFTEEERHRRRLSKVAAIERRELRGEPS